MCDDYKRGVARRIEMIKEGLIEGSHYVSFSGGKDSTTMLLKMIEQGVRYDEIVFADTLYEYDELYLFIDYLEKNYPEIKITTLKPKTYLAKELFEKNNKIVEKLKNKGIESVDLDKVYPLQWEEYTKITLWEFWFYGIVTRGDNAGTVRGFPTTVKGQCWYKREAKTKPLQNHMQDASVIYVGIASDETRRHDDKDQRIKHILRDFNMTEKECALYLQSKGLHNPIYDMYNRSGCWFCPRQNEWGLYMLWKNNKKRWNETKHWDSEHKRVRALSKHLGTGAFLNRKLMKPIDLEALENNFERGEIPNKNLKYECHTCSNVFG